jgi:GNAT superfamily N-acetyltransferase
MTLEIRDAKPEDEADWRRLWTGYNIFYKVMVPDEVTDATWRRVLDPASALFMRAAVLDGRLVGFAISVLHEATWTIGPACYLEDLFVDDSVRGKGVGRALIDDLVEQAKAKGWSKLYWHTDENNITARRLYDQYAKADGHVRYRMSFP